jgi:hypothetical protein
MESVATFDLARQLESCRPFDDDDPADDLLGPSPPATPQSSPDTLIVELPPDDVGGIEEMAGPISRKERQNKRNKEQSKSNRKKKRARVEGEASMGGPLPRAKAKEKHLAAAVYERTAVDIADQPATKGAYTALNKPVAKVRIVSLEELQDKQGFKLIEWDGW